MRTDRRRSQGMADCEQCDDLPVEPSRRQAQRHAEQRGHLVHFIVEDATTYDGRDTATDPKD